MRRSCPENSRKVTFVGKFTHLWLWLENVGFSGIPLILDCIKFNRAVLNAT